MCCEALNGGLAWPIAAVESTHEVHCQHELSGCTLALEGGIAGPISAPESADETYCEHTLKGRILVLTGGIAGPLLLLSLLMRHTVSIR